MPLRTFRLASLITVTVLLGALLPTPALAEVDVSAIEQVPVTGGVTLDDLTPFRMIAVSWNGSVTDEPPELDVHDGTGWVHVHLEIESPDVRPDDGSTEGRTSSQQTFTEPVWVDHAVGLRISPTDGHDDLTLHLARDSSVRVLRSATDAGAALAADGPAFNSRSTWGAAPPVRANSVARSVNLAVVHHTAGTNDYLASDVPAILRSIQAFHQGSRGWNDIAYNFLVDRFGGIWEGRAGGVGLPVVGAHATGVNTGSVGVAVLGDFSTGATPTDAAVGAVGDVVGWKLALHGVDPLGSAPVTMLSDNRFPEGSVVNLPRVVGHVQVGFTACPGNLVARLTDIRQRAAGWDPYARGHLDVVSLAERTVTLAGWALDRRTSGPAEVLVTLNGSAATTVLADRPRPDVDGAIVGAGPTRGFEASTTVAEGSTEVCAWALEASFGAATALGCRTVSVPRTTPPPGPSVSLALDGASGGYVRGLLTTRLAASGPDAASRLTLIVEGTERGSAAPAADGTASITFDTTGRPDGPVSLWGRVVDVAGLSAESSPTRVRIDNTRPRVAILAPRTSRRGRSIRVGVSASDSQAVLATFLALDSSVVGGFTGSGSNAFTVVTPRSGRRRLLAATIDRAGNLAFSAPVWVTVR